MRIHTPLGEGTIGVSYASCSCGYFVVRETEAEARASASTHALTHRAHGQGAALPVMPIAPRWPQRRGAEGRRLNPQEREQVNDQEVM